MRTIKKAIDASKDEALYGKVAVIKMKNPAEGGYMDIDRKKQLYGRCISGTGRYKTGTVAGTYAGFEAFDDGAGELVINLKDCRSI